MMGRVRLIVALAFLAVARTAVAADPSAIALDRSAAAHVLRGELHQARADYGKALALHERERDDLATADTLIALANVEIGLEDFAHARDCVNRARRLHEAAPMVDDLARARLLETRGLLARWESQYVDAIRDLDAAIDLRNHHGV